MSAPSSLGQYQSTYSLTTDVCPKFTRTISKHLLSITQIVHKHQQVSLLKPWLK